MAIKLYDSFDLQNITFKEINEATGGLGDLGSIPVKGLGVFNVKYAAGAGKYGISRNGRVYTKEAWENAFKKQSFKEAFKNKLVVGMLSHPEDDLDYDTMLKEGLASHTLTDIKFVPIEDAENGIYNATFYILNTPAGRTLKALLEVGATPAVSSRAYGSFKEGAYFEYEGKKLPVINENDFIFQCFDIVSHPGIEKARISDYKLAEKLKDDINYLEEKAKEYHCDNGICELFDFPKKVQIQKEKELNEYNNPLNGNVSNNKVDKKELKKQKVFLYYVELLAKLLKYNEAYKDEFETLIEILDKDNISEKSDYQKVKAILDKLKKDELLDKSIKNVIDGIESLISAKNEKELKEIIEKIDENLSLYFWYSYEKDNNLQNVIDDLKSANSAYKLQIKKYKDIAKQLGIKFSGIISEQNEKISKLQKELNSVIKENKELKERLNNINENIKLNENAINENKKLKEENKDLKEKLNKNIESNLTLIEQISKYEKELTELEKLVSELKSELTKLQNELEQESLQNERIKQEFENKLTDELNKLNNIKENYENELKEYKIKYLVYKYHITEKEAKSMLDKKDIKLIENELKEKIDVKDYIPTKIIESEEVSLLSRILD